MNNILKDQEQEPLFGLFLSDEDLSTGTQYLSLVPNPANSAQLVFYSEAEESKIKTVKFKVDESKQTIFCQVLIPGQLIWRLDKNGKKFHTVITEDEIRDSLIRFMEQGYQMNIDSFHNNKVLPNTVSFQNWLSANNPKGDKAFTNYGVETPPNTWCTEIYFKDQQIFNDLIVSGKVKGISIQGKYIFTKLADDINDVKQSEIIQNKNNMENLNLFTKYINDFSTNMKNLFTSKDNKTSEVKFIDAKTSDNNIIRSTGEKFEVGQDLLILSEDGSTVVATDGEYTLEDNSAIIVVEQGKIKEIKPMALNQPNASTNPDSTKPDLVKQSDAGTQPTDNTQSNQSDVLIQILDRLSKMESQFTELNKSKTETVALSEQVSTLTKEVEKIGKIAVPNTVKFTEPEFKLASAKKSARELYNEVTGK